MTIFDSIKYPINTNMTIGEITEFLPNLFQYKWKEICNNYLDECRVSYYTTPRTDEWNSHISICYNKAIKQLQEYIANYENSV